MVPRFTVNLLDGPVPEAEQRYIGHRPTFIWGLNPVFTADLRQLGLEHAQLNVGFAWKWATWGPAGPNATTMSTLYLFKRWGDRRVEMKAGYNINDQEFVGLQVGGSSSTGAQGVYAVLPYEVGMSYYPLMAPSLNFRFRGPGRTYYKTAAQRSLDAAGGQSTINRNPSGLEFLQEGNGLLLINEVGFQRAVQRRHASSLVAYRLLAQQHALHEQGDGGTGERQLLRVRPARPPIARTESGTPQPGTLSGRQCHGGAVEVQRLRPVL